MGRDKSTGALASDVAVCSGVEAAAEAVGNLALLRAPPLTTSGARRVVDLSLLNPVNVDFQCSFQCSFSSSVITSHCVSIHEWARVMAGRNDLLFYRI